MAITYNYANGAYAETLATLPDGRQMLVDTQYSAVLPRGKHASNCAQVTTMGGRCNCGLLDGVDIDALVADARIHGKFGLEPQPETPDTEEQMLDRGPICPRCETYCFGDCEQ